MSLIDADHCREWSALGNPLKVGRSEQGPNVGIEVGPSHITISPYEAIELSGYLAGLATALIEEKP